MFSFIPQHLLYCYFALAFLMPAKHTELIRHPLHVSTADISLNSKTQKLEVICSIFTDDFEAVLAKQNSATKVDLSVPAMHTAMDALVKKYIATHLQIKANGKAAPLTYIGFEKASEIVNVYFESDKITTLKRVDVDVTLLHDLFDDQSNIVHITVNGSRKSTKVDYPDRLVTQVF